MSSTTNYTASDKVTAWRKRTKERMVEAMGSKCAICGYNRCIEALEFHHLDPNEKENSLAQMRTNPASWARIVAEIKKCVLLCANCHREVHAGVAEIPAELPEFDPAFEDYKSVERAAKQTFCCVCNAPKLPENKTCSKTCAAKIAHRVDWSPYDLLEMAETMNNCQIARIIGVSDVSVAKRLKKLRGK